MRKLILLAAPFWAACSTPFMTGDTYPTGPAGPGEAKVVVYRPPGRNAPRDYAVYDGERLVGFAEDRSWFEFRCPAGNRVFLIRSGNDSALRGSLEAGRTYYLRVESRVEPFRLRPVLVPVTAEAREQREEEMLDCQLRGFVPENAFHFIDATHYQVLERLAYYASPEGLRECGALRPEDGTKD